MILRRNKISDHAYTVATICSYACVLFVLVSQVSKWIVNGHVHQYASISNNRHIKWGTNFTTVYWIIIVKELAGNRTIIEHIYTHHRSSSHICIQLGLYHLPLMTHVRDHWEVRKCNVVHPQELRKGKGPDPKPMVH